MTALSVNLNKIALLRNSRTLGIPSVLRFGEIVLEAGADGLTVHPRPDGRHIRADDVRDLAQLLKRFPAWQVQPRRQSISPVDGLRARGPAAAVHVRAG